ncbi:iron export ABC transporter permease subunit FetB [Candidatus Venteria ishoeyi]|uniref:ABC transporter permease n=1 Tax=Candidatus Venteria ishoeyi TaxID=1899563 RepID=UPI0025A663D8|nr:iron export ABC transporter permease subunit FetB [Candidatus Venteria ishoeyi]MDM8548230.1 iron export ABC transporter permease subunit FetB [Candidatus Venteria ishoeyi]
MIHLSWLDLTLAASLLVLLMLLCVVLGLAAMNRRILIAAIRTVVQLLALAWVLKWLFAQATPGWVALIASVMMLAAGYEVMGRQQRRFRGWWGYGMGAGAIFSSSFVITLFTLLVLIQADPWYMPQYAIPLLGMQLGNTMNGISLGLDRLTQSAWQQKEVIEARLMLGQSWHETIADIRRDSIRTGLIPIVNAMAAAGLITLPGMMTGQILAGSPPLEAVKYQILIMFLIATGTGFGTVLAVFLGAKRLFDERERLCLHRLK